MQKMDIDETLLRDWEDESFPDLDDDDFVFNSSLQSQYSSNSKSQSSNSHSKDDSFLKSLDADLDYALALSLQSEYEEDLKENSVITVEKNISNIPKSSKPLSIIDDQWELIDPHPDIHALFLEYDKKFFYGKLLGVEVRWSPRMTLCAGVCSYEGRGGLCSVRLSVPLLKLRPRRDLVETLLHEMIHAYLFVTDNNKDREGHGPEFLSHMNRINKETGTRISVYHSFHDEVDLYRQHWWKCDGPCKSRRPFYGLVKRAMNRAPGPTDNWWSAHQATCGGKYIKIKEPENYKKKAPKRKADSVSGFKSSNSQSNIKGFFKDQTSKPPPKDLKGANFTKPLTKSSNISTITSVLAKEDNTAPVNSEDIQPKKHFVPFKGSGQKLGGTAKFPPVRPYMSNSSSQSGSSRSIQNKLPLSFASISNSSQSSSSSQNKLSSSFVNSSQPVSSFNFSKIPRTESSSSSKNMDSMPSSSKAPSAPSNKLVQSPIKKFFSPIRQCIKEQLPKGPNSVIVPKTENSDHIEILTVTVSCPVCFKPVEISQINSHLDGCIQA